jgi:gliding motility-associated-like protein
MKNQVLSALFALFSLSTFAQVPNYVPANGLVGWWPFTGNAVDSSGNGNDGTVNGATLSTDRFGNANQAYGFDGMNDFISFNNSFDYNLFSINLWCSANQIGNTLQLIYDCDYPIKQNGKVAFGFINSNGSDLVQYRPSGLGYNFSNANLSNQWIMLTITKSQDSSFCYFNGVLIHSEIRNDNVSANGNTFASLGKSRVNDRFFNGKIDDVGIWNRTLSNCEIKRLYYLSSLLSVDDISICPNDTGTLIAQTLFNGGAFQWSSGQQTSSINVSIPTTTTYSVAYTLNGLTCTDSAIVTVIPNQTAFFPSVNPICEGDPLSPLPTSSLNLFQGTWSPPLNNLLTTTYTFTPSPNVCVWDTTTLTIVVKPIPLLSSQDISVCKGQQVTVTSVPNIPNGAFAWSNNTTSNPFVVTADSSTFFTATYTVDGCTSEADTVTIFVYQLPVVSITPSGPTTFCAESSVQISSSFTYGNMWNTNETSSSITVSSSGNYDLIVTDSNGCVDSATIFITNTGITCIQIGGVFTPNGDGTNDTWEIPGIENYPDATVEIFNRWGQQIFYSNGYNSPWNGTYNNERLPTGDYFYIIDLGDGNPLKGALTIKN